MRAVREGGACEGDGARVRVAARRVIKGDNGRPRARHSGRPSGAVRFASCVWRSYTCICVLCGLSRRGQVTGHSTLATDALRSVTPAPRVRGWKGVRRETEAVGHFFTPKTKLNVSSTAARETVSSNLSIQFASGRVVASPVCCPGVEPPDSDGSHRPRQELAHIYSHRS